MTAHAKLSPSGAHRWMLCAGSVEAESALPDSDSEFSKEGTAAHALAEHCLVHNIAATEAPAHEDWAKYDNTELREHVQTYLDYCNAQPGEHLVEIRFDLTEWVPGGFGTSDFTSVNDEVLHTVDLKFGKGVKVDAKDNPQTRLYALGAYQALKSLYPKIERVQMHIVQPRLDWIVHEELSVQELLEWAEVEVRPAAQAAIQPEAPRRPGDKQCQWCRAKAVCKARADANVALAKEEFGDLPAPDTLSLSDIGDIVIRLDELTRWASDIKEYAMKQALAGDTPPGTKLVAGRGRRVWTDEKAAGAAMEAAGMDADAVWERKLTTLGKAEKALGKKHPLFPQFTEKKPGKPALVSADDPRPEYVPADAAALDFAD